MTATEELRQRWQQVMLANYGTPEVFLSHGRGAWVWDVDGNRYLDLIAGIAVSTLGHNDPAVVAAVADQAAQLAHTSNLYGHEVGVRLAERLLQLAEFQGRVLFTQDGATANEAALKLARLAGRRNGNREVIVAAVGGFHGRTMGALAVTGNPAKRDPFAPFGYEVRFVPFGDAVAVRNAVDQSVAAVIVEPIQGENGVVVPPEGYLSQVRSACDESGALLIVDEVQSGIGRTGAWFESISQGVKPDVLTLAKGLAGGLPLGAMIVAAEYCDVLKPGDHGTTFGGNPISVAAALAVIDAVESRSLLERSGSLGRWLQEALSNLELPAVKEVRGKGLWLAVEFVDDRATVVQTRARNAGFLVNAVKPNAIRMAPPLVIEQEQLLLFIDSFPELVGDL